jgi:hypothetical protein
MARTQESENVKIEKSALAFGCRPVAISFEKIARHGIDLKWHVVCAAAI